MRKEEKQLESVPLSILMLSCLSGRAHHNIAPCIAQSVVEEKKRLDHLVSQQQLLEGEIQRFKERAEEEKKIKILQKKLKWVVYDEVCV